MPFIQKLFTSLHKYPDGNTRVGELNRIWYDSNTNTLRIQLDDTAGGTIITGGGTYNLPIASSSSLGGVEIGTNIQIDGDGKISVDLSSYATTSYVTNLLDNYNDLGNFEINGAQLQTLSGTVLGADIILNPNGGSVQVPGLKIGTDGNIINTNLYIEAYITTYELVGIIAHSNTAALDSGVYGNINGVPTPWTVFELTPGVSGTPISAIQINDILTGAGIIPSVVVDRGTGLYTNYVIVNLDLEGLGQVLPITGAVFDLTRPLNKANLNIQSANNTDIFLDSQGQGDVIVNTNILPLTTNISSIGSPTKRWKSVYVGPGTIYVLDETLGKDIAIGARDGLLYIQNGSGLKVGEFTLVDNQIRIADSARDILIGSTGATASVVFNRAIKVKDSLGALAFEVDRNGITSIYTPSGADPNKGTLNIIGTANSHTQPRGTLYDGTLIHLTAQDNKSSRISSDSFGTGVYPLYAARAARGTVDTPTASQSGDILSRITAVGYGDSQYMTGTARFDAVATENYANTAAGTKFTFQTTPNGATAAQLSATINSTGITFAGTTDTTAGITFRNGDRLTYFPTPAGNTNYYLKSNGTTMSWQALPVLENPVVYKGAWNAFTNNPVLEQGMPTGVVSGWEYSIEATGTRDIGSGSTTYEQGGFVIYDGTYWDYIPPLSGVASIQFDGGSVKTGAVQVISSDITNTLNSGSISNSKLANSSVTVTAGTGLTGGGTVSLGGSITLTNAGVTSIVAGTGIGVSGTGAITVTNTGVTSITSGGHITAVTSNGAVQLGSDATVNATGNTIALRDSAGGLEAKDFTATLDAGTSTDHGPFNYGTLSYSDTGIMADFSYNSNSYNQVVLQNRNAGDSASTNYIVSNNLGTDTAYYGEFGMNSGGYTGAGSLDIPSAVYLSAVSSPLVIATLGEDSIHFTVNGDVNNGDALVINSNGVATFTEQIVGSISGSANNVRHNLTAGTNITFSSGTTYDGSQAITISANTVVGYTGSQGNKGDSGYTGSASTVVGYTGSSGIGYGGPKGDTGATGYTGSQGVIGFTGSKGNIGYTGSSGYAGSQGVVGYTGSASTIVGYTGSLGPVGYTGSAVSFGLGGNQLVYELNASLNLTSAKNTLVSMFGLTSGVALESNTRYQYEIVFTLSSNKAGAISYALALNNSATVAQHNFQWMSNKTATIDGYGAGIAMASFNATGATITAAKEIAAFDNFTHVVIYGIIDVTTAGSVNFMLSQDQNTPITWTMLPGAYIKLLPLGAIGANTVAGTWA